MIAVCTCGHPVDVHEPGCTVCDCIHFEAEEDE